MNPPNLEDDDFDDCDVIIDPVTGAVERSISAGVIHNVFVSSFTHNSKYLNFLIISTICFSKRAANKARPIRNVLKNNNIQARPMRNILKYNNIHNLVFKRATNKARSMRNILNYNISMRMILIRWPRWKGRCMVMKSSQ